MLYGYGCRVCVCVGGGGGKGGGGLATPIRLHWNLRAGLSLLLERYTLREGLSVGFRMKQETICDTTFQFGNNCSFLLDLTIVRAK